MRPATVEDLGGKTILGPVGWAQKNVPSLARVNPITWGWGPLDQLGPWACTARRSHRSELGYHAAGFGVSLGKDN